MTYKEQVLARMRRLKRKITPIARQNAVKKYVFIVTYGRSGSTLMQNLIGGLPCAHIVGENAGVPFKLAMAHRDAEAMMTHAGKLSFRRLQPWFGAYAMGSKRFGRSCAKLIMRHVLRPPVGTRIAGFKEIRWQDDGNDLDVSLDFLAEYFSPAYFVCNIRGVESTSRSGWWAQMDKSQAVERITELRNGMIDLASRRTDCHLVDYDEYTKDPTVLRSLLAFLDEPYDAEYVDSVLSRKLTHTGVSS